MAVDFKQVMGVAKKNAVTIGAGTVALIAIAVPFVYVNGLVAETQQKLEARKSVAEQIASLNGKARKLPNVDPDAAEAPTLGGYPNAIAIKKATDAKAALGAESKQTLEVVAKLNERTMLVPKLFTAPRQQFLGLMTQFLDRYRQEMLTGLSKKVKGGLPVPAADVSAFVSRRKEEIGKEVAILQGGQVINQQAVTEAQAKADVEEPVKIRNSVALTHQTYLSTDTWLAEPEVIQSAGGLIRDEPLWFAQVGLWIQDEAATIVSSVNQGSTNVFSSPIKHLVAVRYGTRSGSTQSASGPYILNRSAGSDGSASVPVTGTDSSAAITLAKGVSLTGHVSNGMYDVVYFTMVMRVDETKVTEVLAAIPRGRLVNVLNVNLRAVDSTAALADGYVYGKAPIVEIAVDCEWLMLRSWTVPLMPKDIKYILGVEQAPPPVQ